MDARKLVDGESKRSRLWCFDGWMNVVCGSLRDFRLTLEKGGLVGPHGML